MDTLVADVAVAGIPEPMPVVLEAQRIERPHGRRPEENIPIHAGWHRPIGGFSDRLALLEAQSFGVVDLSDRALAQQLDGSPLVWNAAALHAHLHHAIVFARRLQHLLAFEDVVGGGLFYVHILASLAGPDGRQRVPVVGRGDGDCIDILIFIKLAQILVILWIAPVGLVHELPCALGLRCIDVAHCRHASFGNAKVLPHVRCAAAAHAHHRHVDFFVRAQHWQGHGAAYKKSSAFH